jgi:hypothetical protein
MQSNATLSGIGWCQSRLHFKLLGTQIIKEIVMHISLELVIIVVLAVITAPVWVPILAPVLSIVFTLLLNPIGLVVLLAVVAVIILGASGQPTAISP